MSKASHTSFVPKPTDDRGLLLGAAALQLFNDGVIAHPSNAAIAKYDEAENVARYICLFHDWLPNWDWAHLKFHDVHLPEEIKKFQKKACLLASEGNQIANGFMSAYLGKSELEQLKVIGDQLKNIYFHSPATTSILQSIKQSGKNWSVTKLDYDYLLNAISNRGAAEAKAGRAGHWRYGVELEKIYLSTETGSVFGEYFLQERQSNDILVITASCIDSEKAQGLGSLDKITQTFRSKFTPLPIKPLRQTQARLHPTQKSTIPTVSELAARIPPPYGHKESQRRDQIVEDIEKLSEQQRSELATLAIPISGERYVSYADMEEQLNKIPQKEKQNEN